MANEGRNASWVTLKDYVGSYSLATIGSGALVVDALRAYHKGLYAYLCWKVEFAKQGNIRADEALWFNESVSDLIQVTPLLTQGLYKAAKMLQRSAIENFVRFYLKRSGVAVEVIRSTFELLETAVTHKRTTGEAEVKRRLVRLREMYGGLCLYVHSAANDYVTLSSALAEYPGCDPKILKNTTSDLCTTIRIFTGSLIVSERPTFNGMFHGNQDSVLDVLWPSEKRVLV